MIILLPLVQVVILTAILTVSWTKYRKRLYSQFDESAWQQSSDRTSSVVLDRSTQLVRKLNSTAVSLQNRFQSQLSIAVSLLFSAFLLFATTVCWNFGSKEYLLGVYLTEVFSMAVAFFLMKKSATAKQEWLKMRTHTEMVRRLVLVKIGLKGDADEPDLGMIEKATSTYTEELSSIPTDRLSAYSDKDLERLFTNSPISNTNPTLFNNYKILRIERQQHWFNQAGKRLKSQIRQREALVKMAFFIVFSIAVIKVTHYAGFWVPFFYSLKPALNFISLAAVGFTVLTAGFLINSGTLPLIARYKTQLNMIKNVLDSEKPLTIDDVEEFERLMNAELRFFLEGVSEEGVEVSL